MIVMVVVDVNSNSLAILILIYKFNCDLKCLSVCYFSHLPNISNPSLTARSTFLLKTTMICDLFLSEKAQPRLHTRKLCIRRQFWWCWNHDQH